MLDPEGKDFYYLLTETFAPWLSEDDSVSVGTYLIRTKMLTLQPDTSFSVSWNVYLFSHMKVLTKTLTLVYTLLNLRGGMKTPSCSTKSELS